MGSFWVVFRAGSDPGLMRQQAYVLRQAADATPRWETRAVVCCQVTDPPEAFRELGDVCCVRTDPSDGPNAGRDRAIRLSPPDAWVVELDDDALIAPGALRWIQRAFRTGARLATGDCRVGASPGGGTGGGSVRLRKRPYMPFSMHLMDDYHLGIRAYDRALYDQVGGYRADEFPAGEYALMLRMDARLMGRDIVTIPRVLCDLAGERPLVVSQEASAAMERYREQVPSGFQKYQDMAMEIVKSEARYPEGRFHGRGIVICAGGPTYFTCAWVCINMLRHVGCKLPVELWHLGPEELSEDMAELVRPLGVTCVDALEVRKRHPARSIRGFALKPYALVNSAFEEVLLLDADNVPVTDPEPLFDADEYRRTGAVFWPDSERIGKDRAIWRICGLEHRDAVAVESGQILVDKKLCWKPLLLGAHMNEHCDFYYEHVYGDKDTFLMAWLMCGRDYGMPLRPIGELPGVFCQHDFSGQRVFQHRIRDAKWTLIGDNVMPAGFMLGNECLQYLDVLRGAWGSFGRDNRGSSGAR